MKTIFYLVIFIAIGLLPSCESILNPVSEISETNKNHWETETDVQTPVNAMHRIFRESFGDITMAYRDRGLPFDYQIPQLWGAVSKNDLSAVWKADNPGLAWNREYKVIAQANLVIDNIHRVSLPQDRYNFYLGQALAVRAYTYFYIAKTWGDAPLILKSEATGAVARTPWQEIMTQAIADLRQAAQLLPNADALKDAQGTTISSKQYLSRQSVQAVLAHALAWKAALNNEPELNHEALKMADSVINSNAYRLAGSIKEVCDMVMRGNSAEGIFELDFCTHPEEYRATGSCLPGAMQKFPIEPLTTPQNARSFLRMNNSTVYSLYPDETDTRREEYFFKLDSMASLPVSVTKDAAYIQKWRSIVTHTSGTQIGRIKGYTANEVLIRLADIILLRAELRAKTGNNTGAIDDLNTIRRRAHASDYNPAEDLLTAIQRERDRELLFEAGIRYYDYVRNKIYNQLPGNFATLTEADVAAGALFFPVGKNAFNDNTLMKQTIYWKFAY